MKKKIWRKFSLVLEQIFWLEYFGKSLHMTPSELLKFTWKFSVVGKFRKIYNVENTFEIFV